MLIMHVNSINTVGSCYVRSLGSIDNKAILTWWQWWDLDKYTCLTSRYREQLNIK